MVFAREYQNASRYRILHQNLLVLAVTAAFILAGCSRGGTQKSTGQSLARVDGYELTVHQLNAELAFVPQGSANDPTLRSKALESLINRRLLVAEAEHARLDRDPEVMQAIERQKEQVLVQALLRRKAAMVAKPAANEVQAYYQANPALFANRKVFEMRQIVVPAAFVKPELRNYVDSGRSIDEAIVWLEKHNVPYSTASATHSTAELSQQMLDNLDTIGNGKLFLVRDADRIMIASLHFVKDTPVDEETARSQIEQYLLNRKTRDLANADLARLRAAARIEYLDPSSAPTRTDSSQHIVESEVHGVAKSDDAMSKGVSGLK